MEVILYEEIYQGDLVQKTRNNFVGAEEMEVRMKVRKNKYIEASR